MLYIVFVKKNCRPTNHNYQNYQSYYCFVCQ